MFRVRVRREHVFDGEIALGYGQDVGFYTLVTSEVALR